jgi:GNAT superfamily N-acetyltransferase
MNGEAGRGMSGTPVVTRVGEGAWRDWRDVRLAALADSPDAFGPPVSEEQGLGEEAWREMTRAAAIFIATAGGTAVGVVAGLARESATERGLGAMWVAPAWRGRGVASMLADAVVEWARSQGARRLGLWVPADNARARRFYGKQGFRATGRSRQFPGAPGRLIEEMLLDLG